MLQKHKNLKVLAYQHESKFAVNQAFLELSFTAVEKRLMQMAQFSTQSFKLSTSCIY